MLDQASVRSEQKYNSKMKYYVVADITITSRRWIPRYVRTVTALVESHGGTYLARTAEFDELEGTSERPHLFLLIEFPSKEKAEAFYHSTEYQPFLEARQAGSTGRFFLVAGKDDTGRSTR